VMQTGISVVGEFSPPIRGAHRGARRLDPGNH
jgi:hypothetical protein